MANIEALILWYTYDSEGKVDSFSTTDFSGTRQELTSLIEDQNTTDANVASPRRIPHQIIYLPRTTLLQGFNIVVQREPEGYEAFIDGIPEMSGRGASINSAIGSLITLNPEQFSLNIKVAT